MKEKTIYLSGAMLDCTDAECRDWREYAKLHLTGAALDPMIRDYRASPMDGMTDMVENDKADIDACDIVLVNFVKPSVGTSMEVLYGWERGKKVILVAPPEISVSPWLVYHSHRVFPAIEEAVAFINESDINFRSASDEK
ncbi:MAG: nucleoside 2-deoxyribosyltransferase [Acidobacteriota bacterium]|nr:nucleoside 2-deoxyribosyltransferase [Acidobacteriota bacterium]